MKKISNILKIPATLFNKMSDKIEDIITSNILYENGLYSVDDISDSFQIDISKLKFSKNYYYVSSDEFIAAHFNRFKNNFLYVYINSRNQCAASYQTKIKPKVKLVPAIYIDIEKDHFTSKNKLDYIISTVEELIEHELRHYVQDIMSEATNSRFGYPKKQIDINTGTAKMSPKSHAGTDIEFETNIGSCARIFNLLFIDLSKDAKIKLIKLLCSAKSNSAISFLNKTKTMKQICDKHSITHLDIKYKIEFISKTFKYLYQLRTNNKEYINRFKSAVKKICK